MLLDEHFVEKKVYIWPTTKLLYHTSNQWCIQTTRLQDQDHLFFKTKTGQVKI